MTYEVSVTRDETWPSPTGQREDPTVTDFRKTSARALEPMLSTRLLPVLLVSLYLVQCAWAGVVLAKYTNDVVGRGPGPGWELMIGPAALLLMVAIFARAYLVSRRATARRAPAAPASLRRPWSLTRTVAADDRADRPWLHDPR